MLLFLRVGLLIQVDSLHSARSPCKILLLIELIYAASGILITVVVLNMTLAKFVSCFLEDIL